MRLILLSALLAVIPAFAQAPEDDAHARAVAAGYKALTLCSAHFNAGRSKAQVEALELRGIYPEYEAQVRALQASVDEKARTVSVPFDAALPPRIAAWRPNLGCAQLPIGADAKAVAALPRFDTRAPDLDRKPWPLGERDATAKARGDAAALKHAVAAAFDTPQFGEGHATTGVVVLQDGKIVAERYRKGFGPHVAQRTWSVAKSLAGAMIGVAVREGVLETTQPAPVPEWQRPGDPRAAITARPAAAHVERPAQRHRRQPHRCAVLRWRHRGRSGDGLAAAGAARHALPLRQQRHRAGDPRAARAHRRRRARARASRTRTCSGRSA